MSKTTEQNKQKMQELRNKIEQKRRINNLPNLTYDIYEVPGKPRNYRVAFIKYDPSSKNAEVVETLEFREKAVAMRSIMDKEQFEVMLDRYTDKNKKKEKESV